MTIRLETLAACIFDFVREPGTYRLERKKGIRMCGEWDVSHTALAHAAGRLVAGHQSEHFSRIGEEVVELELSRSRLVFSTTTNYRFEITRSFAVPLPPKKLSKRPPNARIR